MVASPGRPPSENPKDFMLRVRMDQETLEKLDALCRKEGLSRSELVRRAIEEWCNGTKK